MTYLYIKGAYAYVPPFTTNTTTTPSHSSSTSTGPQILFTGAVAVEGINTSPPANISTVTFPYALSGGAQHYAILLTTVNGGAAQVIDRTENGNGDFTGFAVSAEVDCTAFYMVTTIGSKPQ